MEIRLDTEAVARGDGRPFEMLTRVAGMQPFPASSILVSPAAWEKLWSIRRRGIFARLGGNPEEVAELSRAGLLDRRGGLSVASEDLLRVRATAVLNFGATADARGTHRTFTGWYIGRDALVAAEIPREDGSTVMSIHRTSLSASMGLLISWLRIGPAWTFPHDIGDGTHDAAVVTQRVDAGPADAVPLPSGASRTTTRAWHAGEWTSYYIASASADMAFNRIRTGEVGWFNPEKLGDGRVTLVPESPLDVMRDVVGLFQRALRTTH
ncbi:hypothetical protein BFL36_06495 [Clavibacter michiganensis]|uniref:ESX secretion-associated protein EspG n=1 Tax=Clavibacter michiganensis TaxID=28447 RepID=A0A251YIM9_9MICO|nr:hypothetical protein [Clavibacter michiganensis]OUE24013.1 hypothetical protein BFL36_06495 [Clavibacter michiganensis]